MTRYMVIETFKPGALDAIYERLHTRGRGLPDGLHFVERRAHNDLDVLTPQTTRCSATVHRRVSTAQDDHALAYSVRVLECNVCKPVDSNMDILAGFTSAR